VGSVWNRLCALPLLCVPVAAWWLTWSATLGSHGKLTTTVLFDREIVRILDTHCVMCHADGSLAFPLSTYEQTWVRGRSIRAAALRRHMPPWSGVPGYGQFANDNSLTLRELQFLVSWVEGLGPRNAGTPFLNVGGVPAARAAEVRAAAHHDHWRLGEPDVVRALAPARIEANAGDIVRTTVVDLGLTSERRIRGIEFLPSDRRVVRAAVFRNASTGQWLGSWTPWYPYATVPPGAMVRLPAGSKIAAQVHYRGATDSAEAGGTLGLFAADRAANRAASDIVLEPGRRLRLRGRDDRGLPARGLADRLGPDPHDLCRRDQPHPAGAAPARVPRRHRAGAAHRSRRPAQRMTPNASTSTRGTGAPTDTTLIVCVPTLDQVLA